MPCDCHAIADHQRRHHGALREDAAREDIPVKEADLERVSDELRAEKLTAIDARFAFVIV